MSRRLAVKSAAFGLLSVSVPTILFANNSSFITTTPAKVIARYPAIAEEIVAEVVGASHFNLDRLKELVNPRPELARATWDWGFGDWETAIGAASHVARKDIVEYLMTMGARPDIFTFAMLGAYEVVKSIVAFSPGIQQTSGPHGISLLQHAKNGMLAKSANQTKAQKLVSYLEALGDADSRNYLDVSQDDKPIYLGDYKYGDAPEDGFTIRLNMKKILSIGKIGKFGGALLKTDENRFTYNGAPSVEISFLLEHKKVVSLTVSEPNLTLTAKKM